MKLTLKAYNIWEQGPRPKQEDSMFPEYGKITDNDRLFIVCDGMGGHSAGEVASKTVCEALSESILSQSTGSDNSFTDDDFYKALDSAYNALDTKDNGAERKMGTTLTFLKFHNQGCTIAHIGDSRVYHVRPGKGVEDTEILFQTIDHSLVNDLIKAGELTPEEAKHSNRKNIITRAMQPGMQRRPKADIYHSEDIQVGDYFMLCSDGILENMEDDNIKYIFSDAGGDAPNKVEMLINATVNNHDNHSAIVVHITDVAPVVESAPVAESASVEEVAPIEKAASVEQVAPVEKAASVEQVAPVATAEVDAAEADTTADTADTAKEADVAADTAETVKAEDMEEECKKINTKSKKKSIGSKKKSGSIFKILVMIITVALLCVACYIGLKKYM